jgi:hypothetical protein
MVHWIAPMIFSTLIAIANVSLSPSNRTLRSAPLTDRVLGLSTRSTWPRSTTWWRHTGPTPRRRRVETRWRATFWLGLRQCTLCLVRSFPYEPSAWKRLANRHGVVVYENIGPPGTLEWPTTILAILAVFIVSPVYLFYWKGPWIRERSKFAQSLIKDRRARGSAAVRCGSQDMPPESVYNVAPPPERVYSSARSAGTVDRTASRRGSCLA